MPSEIDIAGRNSLHNWYNFLLGKRPMKTLDRRPDIGGLRQFLGYDKMLLAGAG